jgi:hypothetical protein
MSLPLIDIHQFVPLAEGFFVHAESRGSKGLHACEAQQRLVAVVTQALLRRLYSVFGASLIIGGMVSPLGIRIIETEFTQWRVFLSVRPSPSNT